MVIFFRYIAVHYPLNYSQAVNDVNALRKRICKFLLPVCGLSLMFNVTKFFEATYRYSKYFWFHISFKSFTISGIILPFGCQPWKIDPIDTFRITKVKNRGRRPLTLYTPRGGVITPPLEKFWCNFSKGWPKFFQS